MACQTPLDFDESLIENVHITLYQIEDIVKEITLRGAVTDLNAEVWAIKALTLTDLTTLAGDDTKSNVARLCQRAAHPLPLNVFNIIDPEIHEKIHTAAVCVYPSHVADAYITLKELKKESVVNVAAVATGFPSGQYPLTTRLNEIKYAIDSGAHEIDIVINRALGLQGKWKELYHEIKQMRMVCGERVHMKTILGIGELGTYENIYKASIVAMLAGSDFIKTSTGKEAVNATLAVGLVMISAIQEFFRATGRKIGLKPAGGVRTVRDAIAWMKLVKETLGNDWLQPNLFRFGASGLLDDIETVICNV